MRFAVVVMGAEGSNAVSRGAPQLPVRLRKRYILAALRACTGHMERLRVPWPCHTQR